jgi:ankyrin repeat protein
VWLYCIALHSCIDVIDVMHQVDVNYKRESDGNTALHLAALDGLVEVGEYVRSISSISTTLCVIVWLMQCENRVLLENGANVDAVNNNDASALHIAADRTDLDFVNLVLGYA